MPTPKADKKKKKKKQRLLSPINGDNDTTVNAADKTDEVCSHPIMFVL